MGLCCVWVLSRFSRVRLFATAWSVARQALLSMGFIRQEYWSGLPCPPPGDLPNPGVEPESPVSPALAGGLFTTEPPGKPPFVCGEVRSVCLFSAFSTRSSIREEGQPFLFLASAPTARTSAWYRVLQYLLNK